MQVSKKRRRSILFAALGVVSISTFGSGLAPLEPTRVCFASETRPIEKQTVETPTDAKPVATKKAGANKATRENLYVPKFRIEAPLKKAIFLNPDDPSVVAKPPSKIDKKVAAPRDGSKKIIEGPLKVVVSGVTSAANPAEFNPRETTKEAVVIPQPIVSAAPQNDHPKAAAGGTKYFAKGAIERPLKAVFSVQPQFDLPVTNQEESTASRSLLVIPGKDLRDYSKDLVEKALKVALEVALEVAIQPAPTPAPKPINRDRSKQVIEKPLEAMLKNQPVTLVQEEGPPQKDDRQVDPLDESKRVIERATEEFVNKTKNSRDGLTSEENVQSRPTSPFVDSEVKPVEEENPKVAAGLVNWHDDFEAAKKASSESGKPVMLFQMMGQLDQRFT